MSKKKETEEEIKILYVWVDEYKCISKQGFNLDSKYIFDYNHENNTLSVKENENYVEDFFSLDINNRTSKISSITAVVGKNGSGKSTFIDIILNAFSTSSLNDIFIIYSEKENASDIKKLYYYSENLRNINIKGINFKEIDLQKKFLIVNTNQLYKTFTDYYDDAPIVSTLNFNDNGDIEGVNTNLINISENYLLKHDAFDNGNYQKYDFTTHQEKHYLEDLIRQLELIKFLKDENLSFFNFIPKYLMIKVKDIYGEIKQNLENLIKNNSNLSEKINNLKNNYIKLKHNIENDNIEVKDKFICEIIFYKISENIRRIFSDKDLDSKIDSNLDFIKLFSEKIESGEFDIINLFVEFQGLDTHNENNLEISIDWIDRIHFFNKAKFLKNEINESFCVLELNDAESFISLYKDSLTGKNFFTFNWYKDLDIKNPIIRFSSGENVYFSFFSRIYRALNTLEPNYNYIQKVDSNKCILLIDECELALHPEWQRKFIYNLINFIEHIPQNHNFQIVMTSHSPFIVSDLPDENIIFMGNNESNKILDDKTFGSSISKIFQNSFFLENTMGDFSINKIQYIIEKINKKNVNKDEYKKFKKILSKIGDPFIREQILSMLKNLR